MYDIISFCSTDNEGNRKIRITRSVHKNGSCWRKVRVDDKGCGMHDRSGFKDNWSRRVYGKDRRGLEQDWSRVNWMYNRHIWSSFHENWTRMVDDWRRMTCSCGNGNNWSWSMNNRSWNHIYRLSEWLTADGCQKWDYYLKLGGNIDNDHDCDLYSVRYTRVIYVCF